MWEGYLGFYERVADGEWSAWWAPHYEHRILLNRLLYWADIRWFRGTNIFLLAADYVLLALIVAMFWRILGRRLPDHRFTVARILFRLFISATYSSIDFTCRRGLNAFSSRMVETVSPL